MHDPSLSHSRPRFVQPLRDLQPLLPPDPLHPLVVHPPALDAEHVRDASVAVAAESTRESHDITSERPLVTRHFPRPALGRAWLPEHPARSPLRRPELLTYTHHTTSAALGAQKFSLGRFLQDQLVQCQVRHCSLQAPVLALELLQAPCLAHLHPAVLPPPPVVRLLGDAELPAHQLHGFAAGQTDLCLPQCSDDLLRSVSLPSHPHLLAEKLQTRSILTLHLVSFQGVRSLLLRRERQLEFRGRRAARRRLRPIRKAGRLARGRGGAGGRPRKGGGVMRFGYWLPVFGGWLRNVDDEGMEATWK